MKERERQRNTLFTCYLPFSAGRDGSYFNFPCLFVLSSSLSASFCYSFLSSLLFILILEIHVPARKNLLIFFDSVKVSQEEKE